LKKSESDKFILITKETGPKSEFPCLICRSGIKEELKIRPNGPNPSSPVWKKQGRGKRFTWAVLLMALCMTYLSLPSHFPPSQIHKIFHFSKTHLVLPPASQPIIPSSFQCSSIKRRSLNLSIIAHILSSLSLPCTPPTAMADEAEEERKAELERYTDSDEGFTLLRPSSYIKVCFNSIVIVCLATFFLFVGNFDGKFLSFSRLIEQGPLCCLKR